MSRVMQLVNSGIEHRPEHRQSGRIATLVLEPVTGMVDIAAYDSVVQSALMHASTFCKNHLLTTLATNSSLIRRGALLRSVVR